MPKKRKNNKIPQPTDIRLPDASLSTVADNVKKLPFKWTINAEHYLPTDDCRSKSLQDFVKETIKKLNYYEKMDWQTVLKINEHNHEVKNSQNVKDRKRIENITSNMDVEVYQLAGGAGKGHRLFGYVDKNGLFHLLINDCGHKQTP